MADIDDDLRRILEGAGKDIGKIRQALVGSSKAIIANTKNAKEEAKVVKLLIQQNEKLRKSLKENNLLTQERNETIDDNIKIIEEHSKATKQASKSMFSVKGAAKSVIKFLFKTAVAIAETALNLGKASSSVKTFADAMDAGLGDIPGVGPIFKKFGKELDDNTQIFKGLAQSGATFGSSLTQFGNAAFEAQMPFLQFQELVQNNTTTLAKLFGSVNQGIPEFVQLGKALRKFQMDELAGFGITMEETNEFLTTFTEIQRAQGRAEGMNAAKLLQGTKAYSKQLVLLSKLTGQSVTELDQQNRARATDGVLAAKLAQMSTEDAQKFQKVLNLFPAGAQQAVKELGLLGAPVSDAGKALQVLSGGVVQDIINDAMNTTGEMSAEATVALSNRIKSLSTDIQKSPLADAFANAALAGGDAFFSEGLNLVTAMSGSAADIEKVVKSLADGVGPGQTKELVNVSSRLDLITKDLQKVNTNLLEKTVLDPASMFGKSLIGFTRSSNEVVKAVRDMAIKVTDAFFDTGSKANNKRIHDNEAYLPMYNGSGGFQDFGSGTKVELHDSEAVIPEKSSLGQMVKEMMAVGTPVTNKAKEQMSATTNNSTSINNNSVNNSTMDISQLVKTSQDNYELNKKVAQHLNTLVTIGAMTEKNTKSTNNSLANMGGSLV